jgi:hypothetical protein
MDQPCGRAARPGTAHPTAFVAARNEAAENSADPRPVKGDHPVRIRRLWYEDCQRRAANIYEIVNSDRLNKLAGDFIAGVPSKRRLGLRDLRQILEKAGCRWAGIIRDRPTWSYWCPAETLFRRPRRGGEAQRDDVLLHGLVVTERGFESSVWSINVTQHCLLRIAERSDKPIGSTLLQAHENCLRLATAIFTPSLEAVERRDPLLPNFFVPAGNGFFGCRFVFGADVAGRKYFFIRAETFRTPYQLKSWHVAEIAPFGTAGDQLGDGLLLPMPQRRALALELETTRPTLPGYPEPPPDTMMTSAIAYYPLPASCR